MSEAVPEENNVYRIAYRTTNEGVQIVQLTLKDTIDDECIKVLLNKNDCHHFEYSPCGRYIALLIAEPVDENTQNVVSKPVLDDGIANPNLLSTNLLRPTRNRWIEIYETENLKLLYKITGLGAIEEHFYFSPKGNFFVTWQPLPQTVAKFSDSFYNLKVFDMKTGKIVQRFNQPTRQCWPVMRWNDIEAVAYRYYQGRVYIYSYKNFEDIPNLAKEEDSPEPVVQVNGSSDSESLKDIYTEYLTVQGIDNFEITRVAVAVFVPGKNSAPSKVSIYSINQNVDVNNSMPKPQISSANPSATKIFYVGDSVSLHWHNRGQALLYVISTHHVQNGKSYYGETFLGYLSTDGKIVSDVELDQKGPIHSVQWNVKGNDFAVTYGFIPAKTALFNRKCKPLGHLGTDSRNTLLWSPHGRVLCVSGYKDLKGEIDFWDTAKLKKIGSAVSYCTVHHEFSSDGQLYLSAVLWPRRRMDNCIKIFDLAGNLIWAKLGNEIWKAQFQPNPTHVSSYPPPDQDIVVKKRVVKNLPNIIEKKPVSGGAYKHPHWSAKSSSSSNQQKMQPQKFNAKKSQGKYQPKGNVPIGYSPTTKSKKK